MKNKTQIKCDKDWSLSLPYIVGEEVGEKFKIMIDRGTAAPFLRFN